MTIVVGVAAPDGLILAGDSRTSTDRGGHHRIGSDFASKVFEVCGFGLATYGQALFEGKTIAGQIDEFIAQLGKGEPSDLDDLTGRLGSYFQPRLLQWYQAQGAPWDASQGFKLAFIVGGYDANGVGGIREVRVPGDPDPQVLSLQPSTSNPGYYWAGQTDVIGRLLAGFDRLRLDASNVALPKDVQNALAGLEYVIMPPLSLQDAVDIAHFLIRTTIDMQRFSDGTRAMPNLPPGCGGPITMLAIRRRKTEWVDRYPLSKASRPGWAEGAY
jgi:hypothetical protein